MFRLRKPELVPSLTVAFALVLFLSLGGWQLKRLEWKTTLIADIKAAQAQPVLKTLPPNAEKSAWHKADLSHAGRFLTEKTLHFVGKKPDGYVWLVPFQIKGGNQAVLVSQGWIPRNAKVEMGPPVGILRPMRPPRRFSPPNYPEKNLWFSEDKAAMEAATGLSLYPLILDTAPPPPLRNDHLGYALTWFALAAVGVIMFLFYYRIPEPKA